MTGMAVDVRTSAAGDQPAARLRHRIIQHGGRRFSLKLEESVWVRLELAAERAGLRLNELIAQVATTVGADSNITGALRLYCLDEANRRIQVLEDEIRGLSLTSTGVPATLFADACPTPCLIVDDLQKILYVNGAAATWMSVTGSALVGTNVEHYFQIRSIPALQDVVRQFGSGVRKVFPARLVHVRPGRLVMARANLSPAAIGAGGQLAYFMIITE